MRAELVEAGVGVPVEGVVVGVERGDAGDERAMDALRLGGMLVGPVAVRRRVDDSPPERAAEDAVGLAEALRDEDDVQEREAPAPVWNPNRFEIRYNASDPERIFGDSLSLRASGNYGRPSNRTVPTKPRETSSI